MKLAEIRRQHIRWVIAQNPVTVTVRRTEQVEKDGGLAEVKTEHGPYTVRIFPVGYRWPQEIAGLAGEKQVDRSWSLLADDQTDLRAGPKVQDEFDAGELGHFMVRAVYPQVIQGEKVGLQADLERVT